MGTVSNMYLFYVSSDGLGLERASLGLGLGIAGLDYKTGRFTVKLYNVTGEK